MYFRTLTMIMVIATNLAAANDKSQSDTVLLRGGRIIDGTGAPAYFADLLIQDGYIAEIGTQKDHSSARVIDVTGYVIAPGLIDMMGQTATPMLDTPHLAVNLLAQGITTINAGEGASAAPLSTLQAKQMGWRTMREYFHQLDQAGLPLNVAQSVGHTQIRRLVMGEDNRTPEPAELEEMKHWVTEAMQAGAIGLSTALIYPPAVFATTEEIVALATVSAQYGGRYFTHMRNEGDRLLEAIDETLEIARQSASSVHIFHLKAAGQANWNKIPLAIARLQSVRKEGLDVTADIYPYVHNGLGIASFIHPKHFSDGRESLLNRLHDSGLQAQIKQEMETLTGWENWFRHIGKDWNRLIVGNTPHTLYGKFSGQSLTAIAQYYDHSPWKVFYELVQTGAFVLPKSMTEANKITLMKQPFISFCTDAGPDASQIGSHPRAYGAFSRLLGRYVRDLGVLSLEQAISQATAVAANEIMAYDRGRIARGLAADLIVFDPDTITDQATFATPNRLSTGMHWVFVNGQPVWENGKYTGARPGRVLKGPGFQQLSDN